MRSMSRGVKIRLKKKKENANLFSPEGERTEPIIDNKKWRGDAVKERIISIGCVYDRPRLREFRVIRRKS